VNQNILSNFGGSTEVYAGWKSGQAGVIFFLEHMIQQHEQQEVAKNEAAAKKAKEE